MGMKRRYIQITMSSKYRHEIYERGNSNSIESLTNFHRPSRIILVMRTWRRTKKIIGTGNRQRLDHAGMLFGSL